MLCRSPVFIHLLRLLHLHHLHRVFDCNRVDYFQFLHFIIFIFKFRSNIVENFPIGLERLLNLNTVTIASGYLAYCLVLCGLGVETPGSFFHLDLVFCTENSIHSAVLLHVVLLLIKFYLFIYFI